MLMVEMFCVKCKEKKTVPDDSVTKEKTAKGRNMIRAICPTCGTKMVKFVK
jgi:ssDNA-binding Zn-finger/Zn-ribbon topoisomerase 1